MYGTLPLDTVLAEVRKAGTDYIDIWCMNHGNQREQINEMGEEAFAALLQKHGVKLGLSTRYPLGAFGVGDELKFVKRHGSGMVLTGTPRLKDPAGEEAKREIKQFLERMKPHAAAAEELGVSIALENHAGSLLSHPDSLRYFAEFNTSPRLGVAFAPHHLHAWADQMPALIEMLGKQLFFFYAQEYGHGFIVKLPKDEEMLQLPGYGGGLDYLPIVRSLRKIHFSGFVEILMHPTPRGVPILPMASEVTAAINKSREYLDRCVANG